ncbi:unnamed protein product [Prunus armeniaca]
MILSQPNVLEPIKVFGMQAHAGLLYGDGKLARRKQTWSLKVRVYFGCNKNRRAFSSSKSQSNAITKKSPLFLRQPISHSPFWGLLFSSSHATLMGRVGRDTRKRF